MDSSTCGGFARGQINSKSERGGCDCDCVHDTLLYIFSYKSVTSKRKRRVNSKLSSIEKLSLDLTDYDEKSEERRTCPSQLVFCQKIANDLQLKKQALLTITVCGKISWGVAFNHPLPRENRN